MIRVRFEGEGDSLAACTFRRKRSSKVACDQFCLGGSAGMLLPLFDSGFNLFCIPEE